MTCAIAVPKDPRPRMVIEFLFLKNSCYVLGVCYICHTPSCSGAEEEVWLDALSYTF